MKMKYLFNEVSYQKTCFARSRQLIALKMRWNFVCFTISLSLSPSFSLSDSPPPPNLPCLVLEPKMREIIQCGTNFASEANNNLKDLEGS